MHHHMIPHDKAPHKVHIQVLRSGEWIRLSDSTLFLPAGSFPLRLQVPEALQSRAVQWVMEVQTSDDDAAQFQGNFCNGQRAFGESQHIPAVLEVSGTSPITILAAYAAGYEAVALTKPVVLQRQEEEL